MARTEKTVFLSYRRADKFAALLVFKDLTQHGFDVFIDYEGIASGDFERAILDNIHARAHFVLVLTPNALDRCSEPGDWLRREIEVAIESKRNIIPLRMGGFSFSEPGIAKALTGSLAALAQYQSPEVPDAFFDEAMERLRRKYLAVPIDAVLHPPSAHARQVAIEQQQAAASAPENARTYPASVHSPELAQPIDNPATEPSPPTKSTGFLKRHPVGIVAGLVGAIGLTYAVMTYTKTEAPVAVRDPNVAPPSVTSAPTTGAEQMRTVTPPTEGLRTAGQSLMSLEQRKRNLMAMGFLDTVPDDTARCYVTHAGEYKECGWFRQYQCFDTADPNLNMCIPPPDHVFCYENDSAFKCFVSEQTCSRGRGTLTATCVRYVAKGSQLGRAR